jgi:hypothetical protein
VRDVAGIAYAGSVPDEPWAVFDAGLAGWSAEWDLVQAFFDDPLVIITPLPGRRFRVYSRPQSRESDLVADARAVLDRYAPGVTFTDVHNPTRFLCHARVAERFRSGRVLLAGDAAHACSPSEGHGMNTGLQDAYNLGWKLALVCRGEAGEELVDSYDAERRPVAQRIVETGAAADAAQARLDQRERAHRNAALSATFSDPDAVQLELASGAEVDRYYDRSPIVSGVAQPGLAGPAAGRLLPLTAPVQLPDGPAGALHDVARRLGHTLFVLGGPGTSAADVGAVLGRLESKANPELVDAAYGFVVGEEQETADRRVGTMAAETAAQLGVEDITVLAVRRSRRDRTAARRRRRDRPLDGTGAARRRPGPGAVARPTARRPDGRGAPPAVGARTETDLGQAGDPAVTGRTRSVVGRARQPGRGHRLLARRRHTGVRRAGAGAGSPARLHPPRLSGVG